jgi:hypothetical protein
MAAGGTIDDPDVTPFPLGMIVVFIPEGLRMARRTIHIPEATEALVRELALKGESFSATVTRLVEEGAKALKGGGVPTYVASGDGPEDLGRRAETYLRDLVPSD